MMSKDSVIDLLLGNDTESVEIKEEIMNYFPIIQPNSDIFYSKRMSFSKAKALFKKKISTDDKISRNIKGFLKTQYQQKKSWYKVKNPPGMDVGHKVRGVHEWARDNRSRGAKIERGTNRYKPSIVKTKQSKNILNIGTDVRYMAQKNGYVKIGLLCIRIMSYIVKVMQSK
jgi:hypothetical protein